MGNPLFTFKNMANNAIDLVASQEAIKGLNELIARLEVADKMLLKSADDAISLNTNLNKITTPSGLTNIVSENAKITEQLKKQQSEVAKTSDLIIKKAEQSRLAEIRLQQAREKAFDKYEASASKENALIEKQSQAYYKLDLAHKKAVASAQNIGAQYGSTSTQFIEAIKEANKLDIELKQIDSTLGKSHRNVGNYQSAINGLGNALSQLESQLGFIGGVAGAVALGKNIYETTKEIVSLDNALKLVTETSANFAEQQGFLQQISQDFGVDIGSLTKQFTQFYVSAKDKLAGNEIQAIFKSITKAGASMGLSTQDQERAFLALNQMMSKGTIQAEELRGQLGEALPGALGIMAKAAGVNEDELAKMMKAGQLLSADVLPKFAKQLEITYGIENVQKIDNLASAQTRMSNSWTNFVRGLDEDGKIISAFFQKSMNVVTKVIEGVTLALQSTATQQKNAFKTLRESAYNDTLAYYNGLETLDKNDLKNTKQYNGEKILEAKKEVDALRGRNLILKAITKERSFGMSSEAQQQLVSNEAEKKANDKRILQLANLTTSLLGQNTAINSLLAPKKTSLNIDLASGKADEKNTKLKKEKVEATKLETVSQLENVKAQENALSKLQTLKKALEQTRDETSKNSTEFDQFNKSIESVNKAIEVITKPLTVDLNIKKPFEEAKAEVKELSQYLKSFVDEFASNSGFTETFAILSKDVEGFGKDFAVTFNAIAQSAQEVFNFISNASQANFEAETTRVQAQYDIAYKFANGNAEAEAKLAEDLEKKKKEIAYREAKAKQKQAIFNIAIDTAQAIVSLWKSPGFPAAIPLAVGVAALGVAQIAIASSQQIPKYFDGGVHGGGLAMINDAGGSNYVETVVTPDGKAKQYSGRNVVLDLPKGAEIFTPEQWHEQQLFEMMKSNNVSMPTIKQSNGMTAKEMDGVMSKHFAKIQINNTTFDENGMRSWSINNGNKTIRDAKRVSRTGFTV